MTAFRTHILVCDHPGGKCTTRVEDMFMEHLRPEAAKLGWQYNRPDPTEPGLDLCPEHAVNRAKPSAR